MGEDNVENISKGEKPKLSLRQKVINALRLTEPNATPLPWGKFIILLYALMACCYALTFIFSFLPEQVLYFGHKEEEKGYYAGIISATLFAGRMTGGLFWGYLSDKIGRKPVMIISLLLVSICNFVYGFVPSVTWAAVVRFLSGLFNGILPTIKAVMYEITDNTNQACGMSFIALGWGAGIVLGPLVSGYLASPAENYPSVFGGNHAMEKYPYLLASIVASVVTFIAIPPLFFFMPETLDSKAKKIDEIVVDEEPVDKEATKPEEDAGKNISKSVAAESQGLLNADSKVAFKKSSASLRYADDKSPDNIMDMYGLGASMHSLDDLTIVGRRTNRSRRSSRILADPISSVESPAESPPAQIEEEKQCCAFCNNPCCRSFQKSAFVRILCHNKDFLLCASLYTCLAFCTIGADEIFIVWCSTEHYLGGLGMNPEEIGTIMGYSAVPFLIINLYMFPWLVARVGLKRTFAIATCYMLFSYPLVPSLRFLLNYSKVLYGLLFLNMCLQRLCATMSFSILSMYLNNSVNPADAGSANGLSLTISAAFRTLAPIIGGSLFSWSIVHGVKIGFPFDVSSVFLMFGTVFLTSQILGAFVPDRLCKQKKKNK